MMRLLWGVWSFWFRNFTANLPVCRCNVSSWRRRGTRRLSTTKSSPLKWTRRQLESNSWPLRRIRWWPETTKGWTLWRTRQQPADLSEMLDVKLLTKVPPEPGYELAASIWCHLPGKTVQTEDVLNQQESSLLCRGQFGERDKVIHLGEMVTDSKYCSITIRWE